MNYILIKHICVSELQDCMTGTFCCDIPTAFFIFCMYNANRISFLTFGIFYCDRGDFKWKVFSPMGSIFNTSFILPVNPKAIIYKQFSIIIFLQLIIISEFLQILHLPQPLQTSALQSRSSPLVRPDYLTTHMQQPAFCHLQRPYSLQSPRNESRYL